MSEILQAFIALIMSVIMSITGIGGGGSGDAAPEENPRLLNFAVISDTHLYDDSSQRLLLEMGLRDMKNRDLDALVMAGDNTNNAKSVQYEQLAKAFSKYMPCDNVIMAIGNHDTWNKEVDENNRFPESERLFIEYQKKMFNRDVDKVYFSTEVNGYSFICLGSETDITKSYISDEQIEWFKAEMAKAAEKGLPIFVVSHASLDNTHGLPQTWEDRDKVTEEEFLDHDGTFADKKSDEIKSIMAQYDNVFLFSGHIHNGLAKNVDYKGYTFSTVESDGSLHSVNLPSYGNTAIRGTPSSGMGVMVEVYEDEVIVKGRCFSAGVWYSSYTWNIPLV